MTRRILLWFWAAVVLSASICRAQPSDITTDSVVVPGKRGRPDIRCDRTLRGKKCILRVISEKRTSGEFVPYARSFQVGHATVIETDDDRDGFFETLAITEDSDDSHTQVEVFRRARDGTMHAMPADELKKVKEIFDGLTKFWKEAFGPRS